MRAHAVAIALAALFAATPARALPKRGFVGISTATAAEVPKLPPGEKRTFPSALDVVFVAPDSPGETAGVEPGDLVLALDGRGFDPKDGDPALRWREAIAALAPGTPLTLTVLKRSLVVLGRRDAAPLDQADDLLSSLATEAAALPEGGRLAIEVSRPLRVVEVKLVTAAHPLDPAAPIVRGDRRGGMMRELAVKVGREADLDDLLDRLQGVAAAPDPLVMPLTRGMLDLPENALVVSGRLAYRTLLQGPQVACDAWVCQQTLLEGWRNCDVWISQQLKAPRPMPPVAATLDAELDVLQGRLVAAAALREEALASLDASERAFLVVAAREMTAALAETIYLHADENRSRARTSRRALQFLRRIDGDPMLRAEKMLASVAEPERLASLRALLAAQPNAGAEIIARRETPLGPIVIGGSGRNTWRDVEPALIIDLGGDDVYGNGAGSASGDARPISIVLDLGGNDAYEGTDAFVQGCGVLGIGMLVDVEGDDRYLGKDGAQGVGFAGVGIVDDRGGDDRYRALHLAQGAGFFGLGALLDGAGDDSYDALSHAQGLGLPAGTGLLLDAEGSDRYFAKGGAKTGYGTQGVFDAWSQGCGLGLRYLAPGGLGLLLDGAGSDDYEAGNFAQGGGYFLGLGILLDDGDSDDHYAASRYGMGWSAHQACGAFFDRGGNDLYETRHGVIAGLAWDQSVSVFEDGGGDDVYRASFFSLGASAHNAVCFFTDAGGSDRYEGVEVARSGPNDYHGGTSFSLFQDLGEGEDVFEKGSPGALQANGDQGYAIDDASVTASGDRAMPPAPATSPSPRRRPLGR